MSIGRICCNDDNTCVCLSRSGTCPSADSVGCQPSGERPQPTRSPVEIQISGSKWTVGLGQDLDVKQILHITPQRVSNRVNIVNTQIPLTSLDSTDVCPVKASLVGEVLLAEPERATKMSNPIAEIATPSHVFLGRLSHVVNSLRKMTLNRQTLSSICDTIAYQPNRGSLPLHGCGSPEAIRREPND